MMEKWLIVAIIIILSSFCFGTGFAETDPKAGAINGIIKCDGSRNFSAADYNDYIPVLRPMPDIYLYGPTIGDGSGSSEANAINIDSIGAYYKLVTTNDDWGKYILLTEDIDFGKQVIEDVRPTGTFDGGGCCLSNFIVSSPTTNNETALFSYSSATIKNLRVKDGIIIGSNHANGGSYSQYTAVIVAQQVHGGLIYNCTVENCQVYAFQDYNKNSYIGSIVGSNHGYVERCKVIRGSVRASSSSGGGTCYIGGIVGYQTGNGGDDYGYCINSSSSAFIGDFNGPSEKQSCIGGVAGSLVNSGDRLINANWTGSIDYTSQKGCYIGGVVGVASGIIENCYCENGLINFVNLSENTYFWIGGFAGSANTANISRCYSDCEIRVNGGPGQPWVGGFAGYAAEADINNCYCLGSFYDLNADSTTVTWTYAGGFIGRCTTPTVSNCFAAIGPWSGGQGFVEYESGIFNDCFWDTSVGGFSTDDDKATEATTAELVASDTYSGTGFDFDPNAGDWKIINGYDYPRLKWEQK